MATRAVYSFSGFPEQLPPQPSCHLYLHHDGYPAGAAWRFAEALRHCAEGTTFLAAFRRSQAEAVELASVAEAADADYRYRLRFLPSSDPAAPTASAIEVGCWRRLPEYGGWHPRCAPMRLDVFIRRFLPVELKQGGHAELSAAGPPGGPPETPPARG